MSVFSLQHLHGHRLRSILRMAIVAFLSALFLGCESAEGYTDGTGNTESPAISGGGGSSGGSSGSGGSGSATSALKLSPSSVTLNIQTTDVSVSIATQRISVENPDSSSSYEWTLMQSGVGSLTATSGSSTVYTAPTSSSYNGRKQIVRCTETMPTGETRFADCVITLRYGSN